jgi:6-phosphogluconolactonase
MATCVFSCRWLALVAPLFFVASVRVEADEGSGRKAAAKGAKMWVYVGTYTGKNSKGIYRLELDTATGKLTSLGLAGETASPSFLAIHPSRRFLYAVGEIDNFNGKKTGAVSAFAIDAKTGALTLLNQQSSGGSGPCHLVVDKAGKHVLSANYGGGSVSVHPIEEDGRLGRATAFVQHKGSSVDKGRQEAPHAHSINLDPANRFAFVADLGLDKVLIYRFDAKKGTLTPNDPPAVDIAPASGPRHFAFHPSGKYAYVINEMKNTVVAFKFDPEAGRLTALQTISTLPEGYDKPSYTAEVVVHPSGKFLFGSNRHGDSIASFSIDPDTGKLTFVGVQGKDVKEPRNFIVEPTGKFLLVANQKADTVIVFRINRKTGALTPTDIKVEVPVPVCLRLMAIPR